MKRIRRWFTLLSFVTLIGCKANQEPLSDFVSQVEAKARKDVEQLTPSLDFVAAKYQQRQLRAPFVLPEAAIVQDQPVAKKNCWQPTARAKTGKLEKYPLSKLRLKGVMGRGGSVSGLVQTPSGNVIKVKNGQFIGLNNGKVTKVTSKYVLINETLPDGLGCWQKRNVKLALK